MIYRIGNNGTTDTNGINDIVAARQGGCKTTIDAWIDPEPVTKKSIKNVCKHIKAAVKSLNAELYAAGFDASFGARRLYSNLTIGSFLWSKTLALNKQYISAFAKCVVKKLKLNFGVISNFAAWNQTTGNKPKFNDKKKIREATLLWRKQGSSTTDDFVPFGNWTKPDFRLYTFNSDVTCGSSSIKADLLYVANTSAASSSSGSSGSSATSNSDTTTTTTAATGSTTAYTGSTDSTSVTTTTVGTTTLIDYRDMVIRATMKILTGNFFTYDELGTIFDSVAQMFYQQKTISQMGSSLVITIPAICNATQYSNAMAIVTKITTDIGLIALNSATDEVEAVAKDYLTGIYNKTRDTCTPAIAAGNSQAQVEYIAYSVFAPWAVQARACELMAEIKENVTAAVWASAVKRMPSVILFKNCGY